MFYVGWTWDNGKTIRRWRWWSGQERRGRFPSISHWMAAQPEREGNWRCGTWSESKLGTPYTEVVAAGGGAVAAPRRRDGCRLVVDATGVGMPVVDMLRASRPGVRVTPVLITGGAEQLDGRGVARAEGGSIGGVAGRCWRRRAAADCAANAGAGTLVRELMDVRVRYEGAEECGWGRTGLGSMTIWYCGGAGVLAGRGGRWERSRSR